MPLSADLSPAASRVHGSRISRPVRPSVFEWPIADIVNQHHERMDGSGYPQGLRGEDTLLEARTLAVADNVEATA